MTWKRAAAVLLFLAFAAGAREGNHPIPPFFQAATGIFSSVDQLKIMQPGKVYTLNVGGQLMTGGPEDFARRRNADEILASGLTDGEGDDAIVAFSLAQKRGFATRFVDGVEVSTQSIEYGYLGRAVIAVRDPTSGVWARVDPARRRLSFPFALEEMTFDGCYWIGFRGLLADYPAHDPASLKRFYQATLDSIPPDFRNEHLFRFRFTVDPSLISSDGTYRNPNLGRFLAGNGKILAAHGVYPANEIAIRLVAGNDDDYSWLLHDERTGWVCTLGLRNLCDGKWVKYLEEVLSEAHKSGQVREGAAGASPVIPPWLPWGVCGVLCVGLLAALALQQRPVAGRGAAVSYWLCQLLGWGSLLALTAVLAQLSPERRVAQIANGTVFFVSGILLSELLRREIRRRRWWTLPTWLMLERLSVAVIVLTTVQTAVAGGTNLIVHACRAGDAPTPGFLLSTWMSTAPVWAGWTFLYVLLTGPRRHREAEMRLQLALREAELRALEAQVNPHFLFNCLNSIRGLVTENPPKAQDMVTRLANILRYNLRRDIEHTVPLSSEVEIVSDYLALESARFEDRLRVHLSIDPDAGAVQVPPMLLQTLVENALKHGIAPLPAGGDLLIRAAVVGDSVVMEVQNPGQLAESAPQATQLGLANIRERLRIVYGGRASFELKNRDGRVAATVVVPKTV